MPRPFPAHSGIDTASLRLSSRPSFQAPPLPAPRPRRPEPRPPLSVVACAGAGATGSPPRQAWNRVWRAPRDPGTARRAASGRRRAGKAPAQPWERGFPTTHDHPPAGSARVSGVAGSGGPRAGGSKGSRSRGSEPLPAGSARGPAVHAQRGPRAQGLASPFSPLLQAVKRRGSAPGASRGSFRVGREGLAGLLQFLGIVGVSQALAAGVAPGARAPAGARPRAQLDPRSRFGRSSSRPRPPGIHPEEGLGGPRPPPPRHPAFGPQRCGRWPGLTAVTTDWATRSPLAVPVPCTCGTLLPGALGVSRSYRQSCLRRRGPHPRPFSGPWTPFPPVDAFPR